MPSGAPSGRRPLRAAVAAARKRSEASRRGWETRRAKAAAKASGSELRGGAAIYFARRISELSSVVDDPRASKKDRAAAEALRAELIELRDRTLTNARASTVAPEGGAAGEVRRYGEPSGGAAFPEARHFGSGAELLGYLEGRPGVTRVLAVEAFAPGEVEARPTVSPEERGEPPAEVLERIMSLELVMGLEGEDRDSQVRAILDSWWECEDGGAYVEVEVEYEEAA